VGLHGGRAGELSQSRAPSPPAGQQPAPGRWDPVTPPEDLPKLSAADGAKHSPLDLEGHGPSRCSGAIEAYGVLASALERRGLYQSIAMPSVPPPQAVTYLAQVGTWEYTRGTPRY